MRNPVGPTEEYQAGLITKEEYLGKYKRGLISREEYLEAAGLEDTKLDKEKAKLVSLAKKHKFGALVTYARKIAPRAEDQRIVDDIEMMSFDCRQLKRDPGTGSADFRDSFEGLLEAIDDLKPPVPEYQGIHNKSQKRIVISREPKVKIPTKRQVASFIREHVNRKYINPHTGDKGIAITPHNFIEIARMVASQEITQLPSQKRVSKRTVFWGIAKALRLPSITAVTFQEVDDFGQPLSWKRFDRRLEEELRSNHKFGYEFLRGYADVPDYYLFDLTKHPDHQIIQAPRNTKFPTNMPRTATTHTKSRQGRLMLPSGKLIRQRRGSVLRG